MYQMRTNKNRCVFQTENYLYKSRKITHINLVSINFSNNCIILLIDDVYMNEKQTTGKINKEIIKGEKKTEESNINSKNTEVKMKGESYS